MDLEGACTVVTGGAHGIGAALARELAGRGARVLVADHDGPGAEAVAAEVGGVGLACDVAVEADTVRAVAVAEAELGPVALFCANAGILRLGGLEASDDDWRRSLEVNLMAHVYAARAVVPGMLARGGGHLLHTASAAGLLTQLGSAPYSVSKHAVVALAEWLAITHGDAGLRVTVCCPQAVRTAMTDGFPGGGVAGVDGMLEPEAVARAAIDGVVAGDLYVLPHAEVREYAVRRATDPARWVAGMRRLQARFTG